MCGAGYTAAFGRLFCGGGVGGDENVGDDIFHKPYQIGIIKEVALVSKAQRNAPGTRCSQVLRGCLVILTGTSELSAILGAPVTYFVSYLVN